MSVAGIDEWIALVLNKMDHGVRSGRARLPSISGVPTRFAVPGPARWPSSGWLADRCRATEYDKGMVFAEVFGPMLARYFLLQEPTTPAFIDARVALILAMGQSGVGLT